MSTDFFIALLAAYIVARIFLGVLNRMTRGVPTPIRCAVALLILPGVAARLLYPMLGEWADWADVLLMGGLALLFMVDRRSANEPPLTAPGLVARVALIAAMIGGGLVASVAHAQASLDRPVFVIALGAQDGGPFERTVMIATPVSNGHVGFILNRPSHLTMAAVFPEHAAAKNVLEEIYQGGPQGPDQIFAVIRAKDKPSRISGTLMPGVYIVPDAATIDRIIETTPNAARYYAGLVYWEPGELEQEVRKGMMAVRPADPAKLFLPDTSKLYQQLVPLGRGVLPAVQLEAGREGVL